MKSSFFSTPIMHLLLFVDSDDEELHKLYKENAGKHNLEIMNNPFYNAGFDLYLPKDSVKKIDSFNENHTLLKVDFKVKCCAKIKINNETEYYTPFYTYARSSISKINLRLANNQGIIDAGYRGNLIGIFDRYDQWLHTTDYDLVPYYRMLQICAPNLLPIYVEVVDSFDKLGPKTERGDGGFGSTGK